MLTPPEQMVGSLIGTQLRDDDEILREVMYDPSPPPGYIFESDPGTIE